MKRADHTKPEEDLTPSRKAANRSTRRRENLIDLVIVRQNE